MVVFVNVIKPQGLEPLQFPTKFRSPSFGDGSPSANGETASHTFTPAGTYTVTLRVTDSAGRTDTTTETVEVE